MPLPSNFFAPSFRQHRLGWMFSALVGIMVYLATFSAVAEVSLSAATLTWDARAASRLTIEIPPVGDETATPQADRVRQTLGILRAMAGIKNIAQISDEDTVRLLKPWITQPELLKSLPLPVLIDVERAPGSILTADDIRQQIKGPVPDVRIDDHAAWLADLSHFVYGLVAAAALMIVLTALMLALAVNLLCNTIMAAEGDAISLLHIMGATDDDIARHFAYHAGQISWPPTLAGFVLALLSAGGLLFFLRHFADLLAVTPTVWVELGLAVALVPIVTVAIAFFTARVSALNTLYAMP